VSARALRGALALALTLALASCPAAPAAAQPAGGAEGRGQEGAVPVTLKGISLEALAAMRAPTVVDAAALARQLEQTLAGLEALAHMSKMVEENAQRALGAQIALLRATVEGLRGALKVSARVDYSAPPPPPVLTRDAQGVERLAPPAPMSAVRFSQRWGALEAAAFREEKMALVREVAREEHLKVSQAEVLVGSLAFSGDRQDAILLLYPRLVDPEEVEVLYGLLDHESHRRRVEAEVKRMDALRRQGGR